MTQFTYDEAYSRYKETFTHTDEEINKHGVIEPITYAPEAVCNHKELDEIFAQCHSWHQVMDMMREKVGTAGPRKAAQHH